MAKIVRPFAKFYRQIWRDDEFINLDESAQRLFMLLLSQSATTLAGTLPLQITKWSRLACDSTPESVRDSVLALDERCFIVADEDTEELFIRTLMRNDTLYNQSPKSQLGILRYCLKTDSPRIRLVMADELEKCLHMFTHAEKVDEKAKAALPALRVHASKHVSMQPHTAYRIPTDGYHRDAAEKKTPTHNGRGCACGRPAPVNAATGQCEWCDLKQRARQ